VAATAHPEVPVPLVQAQITGTVWQIACEVGQEVREGDPLVIIESMKMEMPVEADSPGVVSEIRCQPGESVTRGQTLVVLTERAE
jgi:biotin carboxyl carrier protein